MQDFRACLNAPRVAARLERDRDAATHSEVRGLPTMFVGHERFEGVVPEAQLRASIDRALRQTASTSTRPQG
jgi:protein-disulfide isomerase